MTSLSALSWLLKKLNCDVTFFTIMAVKKLNCDIIFFTIMAVKKTNHFHYRDVTFCAIMVAK